MQHPSLSDREVEQLRRELLALRPYAVDAAGTSFLFHADCRELLPRLPPGVIEAVVTDPPYGIDYGGRGSRERKIIGKVQPHLPEVLRRRDLLLAPIAGDDSPEAMRQLVAAVLPMLAQICAPDCALYWFSSPLLLHRFIPMLQEHFRLQNVLVWDKLNGAAGDLRRTFGRAWEAIIYVSQGDVVLVGRRDQDILRVGRGYGLKYQHPNQKPVALLRFLIAKHTAQLICDPFAGSGSTMRAARELGRMVIGIESEEKYCRVIAAGLQQTVIPLAIARATEAAPQQLQMLNNPLILNT